MTCARGAGVAMLALHAVAALATPSGHSWPIPPVSYKLFQHAADGVNGISDFQSLVVPRVRGGFARWTDNINNPSPGGPIACTRWDSTYAGQFTSPSGLSAINANDGQNSIVWLSGADWLHDSATFGVTTATYIVGSGQIIDADIAFNNNVTWKVSGPGIAVDVESVVTHEAGHFLGLNTSSSAASVMYGSYSAGSVKVDLAPVDINDVCTVYPAMADGGLGTFCATDVNCGPTNPVCRGPASDPLSDICTTACASASDPCPNGYSCQSAVPDAGMACLRNGGVADLCHFCTSGSECQSGICVTDDSRQHNWCTTSCLSGSDCGNGYGCVDAGSISVCAPSAPSFSCPSGPQCSGPADCAPGYPCDPVKHVCEAKGGSGDRCEISNYCGPCSACVGTIFEAYCQTCCGGQGGGGACTSCSNGGGVCTGGAACLTLSDNTDSACIPAGPQDCQTCDVGHPCANGETCQSDGLCHGVCNPAHPGTCAACLPVGTGVGTCACSGEIAYVGDPCINPPAGLLICTNGTACVADSTQGATTCHSLCTLGDDSTCALGQLCENVGALAVCVGAGNQQPGTLCAPAVGESCSSANPCQGALTCYGGRCYTQCDPRGPICTGCIAAGQTAVCPCSDQHASTGQACGVTANNVLVCSPGADCVSGICRDACNPLSSSCTSSYACDATGNNFHCLPVDAGTPDAGPQSLHITATGCACQSTPWSWAGPGLLLLLLAIGRPVRRA